MVGTSRFGVLRRATQAGIARTTAEPWAIEGGGSVGDRRPRAPDDSTTGTTPAAQTMAATAGGHIADLAITHPVGTATLLATRLLGWPLRRGFGVAVVVDQGLPAITARSSAAPARLLRLWTNASRFRRQWPASLDQARNVLDREVAVDLAGSRLGPTDTSTTTALDADTGTGPRLARLPHRIDGTTVAWAIDVDHTTSLDRLRADLAGLSRTDPRVLTADLEPRPTDDPAPLATTAAGTGIGRWEVVVDFDIEPPPLLLSVDHRTALFHLIDHGTMNDQQQEEGDSHGNG